MKRLSCLFLSMLGLVALSLVPSLSWSGSMEDGPSDNLSEGPSYFGYVRDERGSSVMRANVILQPKSGAAVQAQANVMGAYRTHVNASAKPEEVEVTCAKPGYTFVRAIRRPTSTARVVEIDCQMKRN
jgi:hypothetical protein